MKAVPAGVDFLDLPEAAQFIRWLIENDLLNNTVDDVLYFLSKPWKWDDEYADYKLDRGGQS